MHFLTGSCWNLPRTEHTGGLWGGPGGQGLFSFLPQLVTQGSSVHGLSNKPTVELKHACLHFSSLNVPPLCCQKVRALAVTDEY